MHASSKILWIRTNSSPIASSEGGDLPRPICYPGSVRVNWKWVAAIALVLSLPRPPVAVAAPGSVTFAQSARSVEAFDFLEVTVKVNSPDAQNPFTNATLEGDFGKNGDQSRLKVSGFCDSTDGSVFRIRFMPNSPGNYAGRSRRATPARSRLWMRAGGEFYGAIRRIPSISFGPARASITT